MDDREKNERCEAAYAQTVSGEDLCRVYGRAVGLCCDCAFSVEVRNRWLRLMGGEDLHEPGDGMVIEMIEDLISQLAALQAEMEEEDEKADFASSAIDRHIIDARARLANLEKERDINRQPYVEAAEEISDEIKHVSAQIIDEWSGEKKTLVFNAGTLKFRTTSSLKIVDEAWLLERIVTTTSFREAANKYLKGFNLSAVKKYMSVLPLPMGAAKIEYNTTVKLVE